MLFTRVLRTVPATGGEESLFLCGTLVLCADYLNPLPIYPYQVLIGASLSEPHISVLVVLCCTLCVLGANSVRVDGVHWCSFPDCPVWFGDESFHVL